MPLSLSHQSPKVRSVNKRSDATHAGPPSRDFAYTDRLRAHSPLQYTGRVRFHCRNQGGVSKGGVARRDDFLVREVYSPSGFLQSQLIAEFPYPHILLRKVIVADRTNGFEFWLSPACSRCIPVAGADTSLIRAIGALYITSRVEIRNYLGPVFSACDRFKKTAAFIRWLREVQRMRIDERSNQCYRHPPYRVLERIVTDKKDNGLKRAKILAELRLRPSAILVVRAWILEADW